MASEKCNKRDRDYAIDTLKCYIYQFIQIEINAKITRYKNKYIDTYY